MAQEIVFQFAAGYPNLACDIAFIGGGAIQAELPAPFDRIVTPEVSEYRIITANLPLDSYDLIVKEEGVTVMIDRVRISAANGIFYPQSLFGIVFPDPKYVAAGIDRGDGVRGTLLPCPEVASEVSDDAYDSEFELAQLVELLSVLGGRTSTLGKIVRKLDGQLYEVLQSGSKHTIIMHKTRLVPVLGPATF